MGKYKFGELLVWLLFIPDYLGIYIGGQFLRFKQVLMLITFILYIKTVTKQSLKNSKIELCLLLLFLLIVRKPSLINVPLFIVAIVSIITKNCEKYKLSASMVHGLIWVNAVLVLIQLFTDFKKLLIASPIAAILNKDLVHNAIFRSGIARVSGIFGHPLYLGNFLVILLFYYLDNIEEKRKIPYVVLILGMIYCTLSRMAYILAFGVIVYYYLGKTKKEHRKKVAYILSAIAVVAIPVIVWVLKVVSKNERSDLYRIYGTKAMTAKIFSSPKSFLFGNHNFTGKYIDKLRVNGIEIIVKNVDNFYVQFLYNYGILIFLVAMVLILKIFIESNLKNKWILLVMVIIMNFATSTFEWDFNSTLLCFIILLNTKNIDVNEVKKKYEEEKTEKEDSSYF